RNPGRRTGGAGRRGARDRRARPVRAPRLLLRGHRFARRDARVQPHRIAPRYVGQDRAETIARCFPMPKPMKINPRLILLLAAAGGVMLAGIRRPTAQDAPVDSRRWYKGNTHTHTLNSDGDSTPDDVAKWYREHGYRFVVLTDHNFLTGVDGLNALHGAFDQFLVIKGEEVTDRFVDKPI